MTTARRQWGLSFLASEPVTSLQEDQSPDLLTGHRRRQPQSFQALDRKSGQALLSVSSFSHVDPAPECVKALIFCELSI